MKGYFGIGIEGPSKAVNVGTLFRTAHAFGASFVFTVRAQYNPRQDEYTPNTDPKYKVGGLADRYGRMLTEELKPFIDANYRTMPDAAHTGLGGSSLGGLVTLYLVMKYPNTFGRAAVVSPSVWWGDKHILKAVNDLPKKVNVRIWLDMGTSEGGSEAQIHLQNARDLREALLAKGWRLGSELYYYEAAGASHSESAWADRIDLVLRFLFPHQ